jgi:hypothetical protein
MNALRSAHSGELLAGKTGGFVFKHIPKRFMESRTPWLWGMAFALFAAFVMFLLIFITVRIMEWLGLLSPMNFNWWLGVVNLCIFLSGVLICVLQLAVITPFLILLLSHVPRAFIWLCMAPYSLTRRVDKEGALERTFLLIGSVISIVGIAMCLYKGSP